MNGILLEPLPYPAAARLVTIQKWKRVKIGERVTGVTTPVAHEIIKQCPAFEGVATYIHEEFNLTGQAVPERIDGAAVSDEFFSVLRVMPLKGRPLVEFDTEQGSRRSAIISNALWAGLFGSDPAIVGQRIKLNDKDYVVIGVMPPRFSFPREKPQQIWIPLIHAAGRQTDFENPNKLVVARLNRDASEGEAEAQLRTLSARLAVQNPKRNKGWVLKAAGLKESLVGGVRTQLFLLFGAVALVLMIACVNVSSLLLARSWARRRETAVRLALGATSLRSIRQLIYESLFLSLAGGAFALPVSIWGIRVLRAIAPPSTPRIGQLRLDANVLWVMLGISVLVGVLAGFAPALLVSTEQPLNTIKGQEGASVKALSKSRGGRFRGTLVVVEVGLAVVLAVAAVLVARSLEKIIHLNLGFRTDHLVAMTVNLSKSVCAPSGPQKNSTGCQLGVEDILRRVRKEPGVENAAVASNVALERTYFAHVRVEGHPGVLSFPHGEIIIDRSITPGYFGSMGTRVLAGRAFSDTDEPSTAPVAIVNQTFAREYLGGTSLGKHISVKRDGSGNPVWMEIVGEAADSRDVALGNKPWAEFYVPFRQASFFRGVHLIVRTTADPMLVTPEIEGDVWSVDKDAPVTNVSTMNQIVAAQVVDTKFQAVLFGAFGALGLLLATVGIYGAIADVTGRRTHEIGIRMALGARPRDVLNMVIREGMLLAGTGILLGLGAALALGKIVRSILFEVKATDPVTFGAVTLLLTVAALAACYIPARRAMRVHPMIALRHE